MPPGPSKPATGVSVEFSLALHNRTGKYFIGRDIIDQNEDSIAEVLYWRLKARETPTGVSARIVGKLMALETDAQLSQASGLVPPIRRPRPTLHLDPFSAVLHRVEGRDAVLCHDMGPITHPALFAPEVTRLYEGAYAKIAQARPHMVFVSQASQQAFHGLYGDGFASTRVVYPAISSELREAGTRPEQVRKPYLLTVGNLGDRKNQALSIEAFARSGLAERGFSYVLCGGREPGSEAVEAAARGAAGVVRLAYVPEAELNWLYRNASGFVLASRLEGFGLPVAEAIAQGLVPIVSRSGVLDEVAGPGALQVDPSDRDEIAAAMQALADMPDDEAQRRRRECARSLTRFSPQAFRAGWAQTIADMQLLEPVH